MRFSLLSLAAACLASGSLAIGASAQDRIPAEMFLNLAPELRAGDAIRRLPASDGDSFSATRLPRIEANPNAVIGGVQIERLLEEDAKLRGRSRSSEPSILFGADGTIVELDRVRSLGKEDVRALVEQKRSRAELSSAADAILAAQLETGSDWIVRQDLLEALAGTLPDAEIADFAALVGEDVLVATPRGGAVNLASGPPSDRVIHNTGEAVLIEDDQPNEVIGPLTSTLCGTNRATPETHCAFWTIMLALDGEAQCSGVLLSEAHILTAAHCVCPATLSSRGATHSDIAVYFGSDLNGQVMRLDPDRPPSIYPGYLEGACDSSPSSYRWGDLAVLHLEAGEVASAVEEMRAHLASNRATVDPSQVDITFAHVGSMSQEDWIGNIGIGFGFWGFGVGPDGHSGAKRAAMITLRQVLPCATFACADAPDVEEVIFQDDPVGICASDSGGGVFKPADQPAPGFGAWAVVGIMSGGPVDAACHGALGSGLLAVQYERYVVRLDTPKVRGWLDTVTEDQIQVVEVRDTFDVRVAGGFE